MTRIINIALDLETLSKRANAAIIGIAAEAFSLGGNKVKENESFFQGVDATSCAMLGFDIDSATVEWWAHQPEKVKDQFTYNRPIRWALNELFDFVNKVKADNNADMVHIWCQGTDFDIAVIRNAFVVANKDRTEEDIPWKYADVRDSRTFIFEGVRLLYPDVEDPYSVIPKKEYWVEHDAMSDCERLIHNVIWVNDMLHERISTNTKGDGKVQG